MFVVAVLLVIVVSLSAKLFLIKKTGGVKRIVFVFRQQWHFIDLWLSEDIMLITVAMTSELGFPDYITVLKSFSEVL